MTENSPDLQAYEELCENKKKGDFNALSDDFNGLRENIISLISKLKEKYDFSYENIAEKIGCNKSIIYQIHKNKWFWKIRNKARAEKLLEKLTAVADNFDGGEKDGK